MHVHTRSFDSYYMNHCVPSTAGCRVIEYATSTSSHPLCGSEFILSLTMRATVTSLVIRGERNLSLKVTFTGTNATTYTVSTYIHPILWSFVKIRHWCIDYNNENNGIWKQQYPSVVLWFMASLNLIICYCHWIPHTGRTQWVQCQPIFHSETTDDNWGSQASTLPSLLSLCDCLELCRGRGKQKGCIWSTQAH